MTSPPLLDQALYHASRTPPWPSFPLYGITPDEPYACTCSRGTDCDRPGKHPANEHGHLDASSDPDVLRRLFVSPLSSPLPPRNLAIATGAPSGVAVIDIDPRNGGDLSWKEFCARFPDMRTATYAIASGSDGLHLYFTVTPDTPVRTVPNLLTGVDLKGDGGYVVTPPSRHVSGGLYRTVNPVPLLPLPEPILAIVRTGQRPSGLHHTPTSGLAAQGLTAERSSAVFADPSLLLPGERDTFFTFAARDLVRQDLSPQDILDALGKVYDGMPDRTDFPILVLHEKIQRAFDNVPESERTPSSVREHLRSLTTGAGGGPSEPSSTEAAGSQPGLAPPSDAPAGPNQHYLEARVELPPEILEVWDGALPKNWMATGRGVADLALLQYGHLIAFVRQTKTWLRWTPSLQRWQEDAALEVSTLIQGTADSLLLVAATTDDEDLRDNLPGFVRSLGWANRIYSIRTTLEADVTINYTDLNAHAQALPVENGVLDASQISGAASYDDVELSPLSPQWLFTKETRLRHDVAAYSLPLASFWSHSLERWFPNEEVREFAQRLMGYAVFGQGQEKVFVIAYGPSNSGKSAFLNNLAFLLKDFAVTIAAEALLASKFENEAQYGLSHIGGARLYVSSETKPDAKLNTALIKRLTSGGMDIVRARQMRENFIDIIPRGLLCIMTNHVPHDDQLDEALWDRTIILPFQGKFLPDDPDTIREAALQELLLAERAGVLQWLVEGFASYTALGLQPPKAGERETKAVREEQDWTVSFIATHLVETPDVKVLCRDVWLAYEAWCRDTGDEPLSRNAWGRVMREHLTVPKRGTAGRHYYPGWSLTSQAPAAPEPATELPPNLRAL